MVSTPSPRIDQYTCPALISLDAVAKAPAPWLLPYLPLVQRVLRARDTHSVPAALNAAAVGQHAHVRFVEQFALPKDEPYEAFIFRTGCVPTRDDLHDLFNGLVWLSYPQTKQRLNALHAHEMAQRGAGAARGTLRDALTVFDENAAVLRASDELVDALRARDWHALFVSRRELWNSARLVLFGHALMQKLLQPRKNITAHVWVTDEISDTGLASSLVPERLTVKPFLPLPVLGVPGWWPANEAPGFYADATVFRARPSM